MLAAQDDDDILVMRLPEHCADVSKQLAEMFPINEKTRTAAANECKEQREEMLEQATGSEADSVGEHSADSEGESWGNTFEQKRSFSDECGG